MFNRIMGLVADTQQEWPADLQEKLHPHMKFDLHKHQLAALDFVLKARDLPVSAARELGCHLIVVYAKDHSRRVLT